VHLVLLGLLSVQELDFSLSIKKIFERKSYQNYLLHQSWHIEDKLRSLTKNNCTWEPVVRETSQRQGRR